MGRENGGEAPIQLRSQSQDDVVDKGGGVAVLRLLVGAGAEEAQPRLVEAGDGMIWTGPSDVTRCSTLGSV